MGCFLHELVQVFICHHAELIQQYSHNKNGNQKDERYHAKLNGCIRVPQINDAFFENGIEYGKMSV